MPRAEPALLLCSRSLARAPRGLLSAAAASGGAAAAGAGAAPTMSGEEEAAELTIAEDLVVTKYKMGGDIANRECRAAGGRGAEGGGGGGRTDGRGIGPRGAAGRGGAAARVPTDGGHRRAGGGRTDPRGEGWDPRCPPSLWFLPLPPPVPPARLRAAGAARTWPPRPTCTGRGGAGPCRAPCAVLVPPGSLRFLPVGTSAGLGHAAPEPPRPPR